MNSRLQSAGPLGRSFQYGVFLLLCAGGIVRPAQAQETGDIKDGIPPTYSWIRAFPDGPQPMDEDCSLTFPIEILVLDNCCIAAANVLFGLVDSNGVTVTDTLTRTQEGIDAVRIRGDVTVSSLTDGEATISLDVDSTDCCGNSDSTSDSL